MSVNFTTKECEVGPIYAETVLMNCFGLEMAGRSTIAADDRLRFTEAATASHCIKKKSTSGG